MPHILDVRTGKSSVSRWMSRPSRRTLSGCALFIVCACTPFTVEHPLQVSAPHIAIGHGERRAPREAIRAYDSFWSAITALDLRMGWILADDADQRHFTDGLEAMLGGSADSAEAIIAPLLTSSDSVVRAAARLTYGAMLSADGRWGTLARYADSAPRLTLDSAGVESWAPAFRDITRTVTFDDTVATLPLERSAATGAPIVPVVINGKTKHFWLDTGSSITILSSDVAAECAVAALGRDTLQLLTSVGRLPARPALVRSLSVGGLTLTSMPAMIVRAASLHMHGGRAAPAMDESIDGVLGFDVIRAMDLTIDDLHGRVVVRKPVPREGARNLSWFGVPIVTLRTEDGVPVHLALDTGSEETFGTRALVIKTGAGWAPAERRRVRGFGGAVVEPGIVIRKAKLFLGTTPVEFQDVFLYVAQYPTLFALDGTLGNDAARGGVLRIDMTNGRVDVASK